MVGPFIFFDHMGPAKFAPGAGIDVRPHPHINLATITYLFTGEIMHRDSLGSAQIIRPGDVNWMTAGRGIVHSERTPEAARAAGTSLNGIQAWVALPREHEEVPPSFQHCPSSTLPVLEANGARLCLIAGAAFGKSSPVVTHSSLFYVDAELSPGARVELPIEYEERAAYLVEGQVTVNGHEYQAPCMVIFSKGERTELTAAQASRVMLLGGAAMDGPRHIWWNFVSSRKERIESAKRAWAEGQFPKVPGDEVEFIPLPEK